jgi:ankyrin repeat protein
MVKELFEVATKGDIERLRELFEDPESLFSTDPAQALNKRDKDGKSALDIAAMLGRKEIVRELLERGAQINSQTKKGTLFTNIEKKGVEFVITSHCGNWALTFVEFLVI